jgi:CheY-like chemotaxis protein
MFDTLNILVIEDYAPVAQTLCRLVSKRIPFATCRISGTFADGLEKANSQKADLTILDIHLPDVDIDTVVTSIPKFPRPVIVVTEMDDPDGVLMAYCYAYGAENFFAKRNLLKIIDTWDAEMTSRQLVSSIASAHFRNTMPDKRHIFTGGVKQIFKADIQRLDDEMRDAERRGELTRQVKNGE